MPTMNRVDMLNCAAGHHDFSDDSDECHVCGLPDLDASTPAPDARKWTVLLLLPDFLREDQASEYDWTRQFHVEAETPEEAFGKAQDSAVAGMCAEGDYDKPEPELFAVLAVYPGHLQSYFIP